MTVAVRPLVPGDRPAWEPLWQGYLRFYKAEVPDATTELTWQRFHDPDEPMTVLGAFDNSRLFGIVHLVFHRSCWTAGDYCYLQDLFVEDGRRGSGAGRALIEAACRLARERGASRIHWLTHESNRDAMALYETLAERSGFIQYRRPF